VGEVQVYEQDIEQFREQILQEFLRDIDKKVKNKAIAQTIVDGLTAQRSTRYGLIPDHKIRLEYVKIAAKLKGLDFDQVQTLQVGGTAQPIEPHDVKDNKYGWTYGGS